MSWNESHTEKALILSQARDSCSTKYYTFRIWSNLFYCMVFIIAHSISTALISISFIIFFSFIAHSEFFYTSFTIFILAVCKWRDNRKTYKTPDICRWIKWFLKFIFSVSSLERVYHPWLKRTIKAQCHIENIKIENIGWKSQCLQKASNSYCFLFALMLEKKKTNNILSYQRYLIIQFNFDLQLLL